MKLYFKYDTGLIFKKILEEQLEKLQLSYLLIGLGEVETKELIAGGKLNALQESLSHYGIEIVESQKSILVQKTKDAIIQMVYMRENITVSKVSIYLSKKLNYSYGYIFDLFSEVTHTSIENFIILQKIERAKQLLSTGELNVTEIAYELNYGSVAYFSYQFKFTTGLTPSAFRRIIGKRRNIKMKNLDSLQYQLTH